MIPGIEDILRMLLAGDIDQAQAQSWIDRHIEMAAEMDGLRDHFAGVALPVVLGLGWRDLDFKPIHGLSIMENNALCAYQQADAMLKARVTAPALFDDDNAALMNERDAKAMGGAK